MFSKIFRKRKILIITDDDIKSLPLTPLGQFAVFALFVSFIVWSSFSSGKYISNKQTLRDKEQEVQQANLINLDLQTKIDNLQGNLVRLNHYFETVTDLGAVKGKNNSTNDSKLKGKDKNSFLKEAIGNQQDLAYEVNDHFVEKEKKAKVVADIHSNAESRISNLEKVISMTGLQVSDVVVEEDVSDNSAVNEVFSFGNQGGPFVADGGEVKYGDRIDSGLQFAENMERLVYLEQLVNSMPLASPMSKFYLSSRYGKRIDPVRRKVGFHYGTDFAGPIRATVYATGPGVVKYSGRKGSYGNLIEIDHGYGVTTRYGHLNKTTVSKGDILKKGDIIGYQGDTGRSTGPHLHYEIRYKGKPYNPEKFLRAGSNVL
jgi:murein DD-endopeptidase MepM/ murein hydrolase activator NlpD